MFKYLFPIIVVAASAFACSSHPSPRQITMEFVGSVVEGDSLEILHLLDIDLMVKERMAEIPPTDSTQTAAYFKKRIIENLTGDGGTREYWKAHRLVVNDQTIKGDTAQVELTLMDPEKGGIQYLTVYLYRTKDGWRVFKYL